MSWLDALFGVPGASKVNGIVELSTEVAMAAGALLPMATAVGSAMSCAAYVITLSFFLSTPGVAELTSGGFPAISAPIGQFLLKDLVLIAASLYLLRGSIGRTLDGAASLRGYSTGMMGSDAALETGLP